MVDPSSHNDPSNDVDIKVTPPSRQNTIGSIAIPTDLNSSSAMDGKNDSKEIFTSISNMCDSNEDNDIFSDTCEINDKDAYGDIRPDAFVESVTKKSPELNSTMNDPNENNLNDPVNNLIKLESEMNESIPNAVIEPDEFASETIGSDLNTEEKQADTSIIAQNNTLLEEEEGKDAVEFEELAPNGPINLTPATLGIANASSAFDVSTYYV